MQKTKIEWVRNPDGSQGYSWNPIKGPCPGNCFYCYGHSLNKRFWKYKEPFFDYYTLFIGEKKLGSAKNPRGIFICSTFDLFHPITKDKLYYSHSWRYWILRAIKNYPQHRFYILTKFPQNIDRPMPSNVWLGVTCDWQDEHKEKEKIRYLLLETSAEIKFVSYEPLLGEPRLFVATDWVIIGKLTQHGNKYDPKKGWIERIVNGANRYNIPVFLKDNLKEIWGEPLIQEMPE